MKKKRTKNYSAIFKHHETIKIFKIFSRGQSLFILIDIKKTKKILFILFYCQNRLPCPRVATGVDGNIKISKK